MILLAKFNLTAAADRPTLSFLERALSSLLLQGEGLGMRLNFQSASNFIKSQNSSSMWCFVGWNLQKICDRRFFQIQRNKLLEFFGKDRHNSSFAHLSRPSDNQSLCLLFMRFS
jgi:hypothetical protein